MSKYERARANLHWRRRCLAGSGCMARRIRRQPSAAIQLAAERACILRRCGGGGLAGSGWMARRIQRHPSAVNQVAAACARVYFDGLAARPSLQWLHGGNQARSTRWRRRAPTGLAAAYWLHGAAYQAARWQSNTARRIRQQPSAAYQAAAW